MHQVHQLHQSQPATALNSPGKTCINISTSVGARIVRHRGSSRGRIVDIMVGLTRRQRRITAWIACFAVLLASLAPSISHALVAAGSLKPNPVWLASWSGDSAPRPALVAPHASHMHGIDMEGMDKEGTDLEGMDKEGKDLEGMDMERTSAASPEVEGMPTPKTHLAAEHASASHSPASHSPATHFEHCPFCFTHAGSFGLPFVASIVIPALGAATIAPFLFYRAPRPLFAWTAPQSRAPPFLS
ncbi:MAG: hypothetical protein JWR21_2187 [Herminiimonas sp.]|nr:hypothetical protein [Herminiimonas sp.]